MLPTLQMQSRPWSRFHQMNSYVCRHASDCFRLKVHLGSAHTSPCFVTIVRGLSSPAQRL